MNTAEPVVASLGEANGRGEAILRTVLDGIGGPIAHAARACVIDAAWPLASYLRLPGQDHVAVTAGLLCLATPEELRAVTRHEVGHLEETRDEAVARHVAMKRWILSTGLSGGSHVHAGRALLWQRELDADASTIRAGVDPAVWASVFSKTARAPLPFHLLHEWDLPDPLLHAAHPPVPVRLEAMQRVAEGRPDRPLATMLAFTRGVIEATPVSTATGNVAAALGRLEVLALLAHAVDPPSAVLATAAVTAARERQLERLPRGQQRRHPADPGRTGGLTL